MITESIGAGADVARGVGAAAIGRVDQLDAGALLQLLARHVAHAGGRRRAVADRCRLGLGRGDVFLDRLGREILLHRDDLREVDSWVTGIQVFS